MEALDFNDIREQIEQISTLVESYEDFSIIEDDCTYFRVDKYRFSGTISINGKPVYTCGSYKNVFEEVNIIEFTADNEELAEYLENYELDLIQYKIEKAS
jgi:hypothetical protein